MAEDRKTFKIKDGLRLLHPGSICESSGTRKISN